jgi:hypothetical protein
MSEIASSEPAAETAGTSEAAAAEELLVADDRAGLRPSDMVERKLAGLLKSGPLPVSQLGRGRRLARSG